MIKRALPTLLVLAALACASLFWFHLQTDDIAVDNAFVTGQVVKLLAPRSGRVGRVRLARFAALHGGELAFVIGEEDVETEIVAAREALGARLLAEAQKCFMHEEQLARAHIAGLGAREARRAARASRGLAEKGLYPHGTLRREETDAAQAEVYRDLQTLEARRLSVEASGRASSSSELAEVLGQLRRALHERQLARVMLPADAFVYDVHVLEGQWVAEGAPLATIVPTGRMQVQANVMETQVKRLFVGQLAEVRSDGAGRDQALSGRVTAIVPATAASFSPVPRNNTDSTWIKVSQRVPVVVTLDAPRSAGLAYVGQSVEVRFLPRKAPREQARHESDGAEPSGPEAMNAAVAAELRELVGRAKARLLAQVRLPRACHVFASLEVESDGQAKSAASAAAGASRVAER